MPHLQQIGRWLWVSSKDRGSLPQFVECLEEKRQRVPTREGSQGRVFVETLLLRRWKQLLSSLERTEHKMLFEDCRLTSSKIVDEVCHLQHQELLCRLGCICEDVLHIDETPFLLEGNAQYE
jgi:hypothetical protein